MRRTALVVLGAVAVLAVLAAGRTASALPGESTVLPPDRPGRAHPALLVLLPASGQTAAAHLAAAQAAQRAADGIRLWVAIGDVGAGPAAAAVQYELLTGQARADGFTGLDEDVTVAAWGDSAPALAAIAQRHAVAATAALGSDAPGPDGVLRVLGELDRSVRVVRSALTAERLIVLPGAGPEELRGSTSGAVLGDLVQSRVTDPTDLQQRLADDRLVNAVRSAAVTERGGICADLQLTTADLDPLDAHRLAVINRVSKNLVAPTPDGVAQRDFGGFLYDKASLSVEGDIATVTTNSYAPTGHPAPEVMCKTKSRSAVAQAVYGTHLRVDGTTPSCADFTRGTLDWVRAQLSPLAVQRSGGVTVLPDVMKAAGPEWVFSPLVVRPADPVTARWEVQSPALVTELSDTDLDPRFAGVHYCKVLSPVRALELVLEDTAPLVAR